MEYDGIPRGFSGEGGVRVGGGGGSLSPFSIFGLSCCPKIAPGASCLELHVPLFPRAPHFPGVFPRFLHVFKYELTSSPFPSPRGPPPGGPFQKRDEKEE
jgi:hypothetical protein